MVICIMSNLLNEFSYFVAWSFIFLSWAGFFLRSILRKALSIFVDIAALSVKILGGTLSLFSSVILILKLLIDQMRLTDLFLLTDDISLNSG